MQRLAAVIAELGWFAALVYGLDRLCAKAGLPMHLQLARLMAVPVAPASRLPVGRGRGIAVREVGAGDPALRRLEVTPEVQAYRFARGAECLAATKGGEPIGCVWLAFNGYREDVFRCRFTPQPRGAAAWDFGLYIVPDQRLGLAFVRLWEALEERLRARGIRWTMSRIDAANPVSLAAHARLGAVRLGSLLVVAVGGVELLVATLPPFLRASRRGGTPPELRLAAPDPVARRSAPV